MGSIVMNKYLDGWIMVDKNMVDKNMLDKNMVDKNMVDKNIVDNVFRSRNNKQRNNVKSEVPDWTIINYPDVYENESKINNNFGVSRNKEGKENDCSKDTGVG